MSGDMFTRFDRIYERDRQTDTHTGRQTDGHRMTVKATLDASIVQHKVDPRIIKIFTAFLL